MKCVVGCQLVASWMVREQAGLGGGSTSTAADRPISAQLEQHAGRIMSLGFTVVICSPCTSQTYTKVKDLTDWICMKLCAANWLYKSHYLDSRLLRGNMFYNKIADQMCVFSSFQINWNVCSFVWAMQKLMNNCKTLFPSSFLLCSSNSPVFRRECERK